jgi:hypothetical protein
MHGTTVKFYNGIFIIYKDLNFLDQGITVRYSTNSGNILMNIEGGIIA